MGDPARRVPTFDELYEQIRRLPQHLTGEILEPGVIRTMSRPGSRHQFTSRRILGSVAPFDQMEGGSGWWFEVEREIRFPQGPRGRPAPRDKLAVPDIAGWKVDEEPDFVEDNPIARVPDWCCEILSRTTSRDDRQLKLPLYARAGVGFVWLVDPELRAVEVYASKKGLPTLVATAQEDDKAALPPFGARVAVGRYWKRTRSAKRAL